MDEDTQSALVQGCLAVSMHMQGGMKGFAGRLCVDDCRWMPEEVARWTVLLTHGGLGPAVKHCAACDKN